MTRCVPVAWQAALLAAGLAGCGRGVAPDEPAPYSDTTAGSAALASDLDGDGLCDDTEIALGTDPNRADSDGDGLPDALEQIAGTDTRDRLDPNTDRVAYLRAGETLEFDIAVVVEQAANSVRGELVARTALDAMSRRASDFFLGLTALSAQPPENVHRIEPDKARFVSVLAHTRLVFRLRFASPEPVAEAECAPALPFDLLAVDDAEHPLASERALLIVLPQTKAELEQPVDYCLPVACL